jgi:hypothetical protein
MHNNESIAHLERYRKKQKIKNRNCLHQDCSYSAINSHLLQKNGILNNIAKNGHVIQLSTPSLFSIFSRKNQISEHKEIGVNQAFSLKLFCNEHDRSLFNPIETPQIDFFDYQTGLLLSYRALCAEIRKKEVSMELFNWVRNQKNLWMAGSDSINDFLQGTSIGIRDLNYFKNCFENEILCKYASQKSFKFEVFEYSYTSVCAAAIITFENTDNFADPFIIPPIIFINVIPYNNKTIIVCGYHINYLDGNVQEFINSWCSLTNKEFQYAITRLIAGQIETWCMSPDNFAKIPKKIKNIFIKHWNHHIMYFSQDQSVDFNLFNES